MSTLWGGSNGRKCASGLRGFSSKPSDGPRVSADCRRLPGPPARQQWQLRQASVWDMTPLTGAAERSLLPRGAGSSRGVTISYFSTWESFSSSAAVVPGRSQRALSRDTQKQQSQRVMEAANMKAQERAKPANPKISAPVPTGCLASPMGEQVLSRLENPTNTLVHKYSRRFFSSLTPRFGTCVWQLPGVVFRRTAQVWAGSALLPSSFLMSEGRHFCDKPFALPMSPKPGAHAAATLVLPGSDGAGEAPARRRQRGVLRLRVPGSPRPRHQVGARSLITTPSAG